MSDSNGRSALPIACTLSAGDGPAQLAAWRGFNADYLLDIERSPGRVTAHYPKIDDAIQRLNALVVTERTCCSFAEWTVAADHHDLRLIVTGTDAGIDTLTFLVEARPA